MIRVFVVDSDPTSRGSLCNAIHGAPTLQVCGQQGNERNLISLLQRRQPHVLVLDLDFPKTRWEEVTEQVMSKFAVPIVGVCAQMPKDQTGYLRAGIVKVEAKPTDGASAEAFVTAVELMASVRVVTRKPRKRSEKEPTEAESTNRPSRQSLLNIRDTSLIAIGASTGGPQTLKAVLKDCPPQVPPVVIAQHITDGFTSTVSDWLDSQLPIPVKVAQSGMKADPGTVYFPPDGHHLCVRRERGYWELATAARRDSEPICPSVNRLFHSIAEQKERVTAILLTGMGRDGAEGLLRLQQQGSMTLVQSLDSCVVNSMPSEALKLGAARYRLSPAQLSDCLIANFGRESVS